MRPGRELDTFIAKEVFGHNVKVKQKELWEDTQLGDRPLKKYSRDLTAAWQVADKMNISVIPVSDNKWFAMVGPDNRYESPAEFLKFLQAGEFCESGAAVGENLAEVICLAATHAIKTRATSKPTKENQPIQLHS